MAVVCVVVKGSADGLIRYEVDNSCLACMYLTLDSIAKHKGRNDRPWGGDRTTMTLLHERGRHDSVFRGVRLSLRHIKFQSVPEHPLACATRVQAPPSPNASTAVCIQLYLDFPSRSGDNFESSLDVEDHVERTSRAGGPSTLAPDDCVLLLRHRVHPV